MPARRPVRTALAVAAVALLSATAVACGDAGGLRGAGATAPAVSPAKLWPDLRPASSPAYPYAVATRAVVKGIKVPGDDIHKVDPVDVVEAEIKAHPDDYGSKGAYHATVDRLKDCQPGGDQARCPLLTPYYRDLTGDGRDDMTLGFRLYPTNQTAVRVYTVEKHKLVQVLSDNDAIIGVELAGRALIERSPADISGYEYRTTWVWDPGQRAMVFSRDEYLHTGSGRHPEKPSPSVTPSLSPSATPSTAPSTALSASAR
ncbi:hypothetical protein AV521_41285 [Streptomyces sp. IMTB 2501]|uniref:hypothetical protein n=1 Tax=Streptomyces sp. IMTB 2501 TaxID=1776340 RepID=UPI00096ECF73|nr:hypothetical protein [Streptomyces sp. IMTB 2501]OLZ62712.1 hypothetical protein AV521_41285 [Streptomyces sp. IMTB 2501]